MPATIDPMACKLVAHLPAGDEWLYELKWDGYRAIGRKAGATAELSSRRQKSFAQTFPEVQAALASLRCKSAVVDGEVVAVNAEGRPSFQALQKTKNRTAEIRFYVFDLLELDGKDLRMQPLTRRRRALEKILPPPGVVRLSPELPADPAALMDQAAAQGFEGIVAKKRASIYEEGERSGSWVKWKAERSETFLIGGYVPNGRSFSELVIGKRAGKRLRYVARVKAGFVPATRQRVMEAIAGRRTDVCPFFNLPEPKAARWGQGLTAEEMEKCRWVKPTVKVDVAFVEWTEAMHLRHSRFVALMK